jgi:hypothetical protein
MACERSGEKIEMTDSAVSTSRGASIEGRRQYIRKLRSRMTDRREKISIRNFSIGSILLW